jgi:hypothetical protein
MPLGQKKNFVMKFSNTLIYRLGKKKMIPSRIGIKTGYLLVDAS